RRWDESWRDSRIPSDAARYRARRALDDRCGCEPAAAWRSAAARGRDAFFFVAARERSLAGHVRGRRRTDMERRDVRKPGYRARPLRNVFLARLHSRHVIRG